MTPQLQLEPREVALFDTTLRDGTQRRGISLTVQDKVTIARILDEFGIHYIEGGWPGSNPKDQEFFLRMKNQPLSRARLVAFGSTRRKNAQVREDSNLRALLEAETPTVSVVGKSSRLHIEKVLETSCSENERMIFESIAYLTEHGREVVYDAEHFFDGYKLDSTVALASVQAAARAGAAWIVFCDTNGGSLPEEIAGIVRETIQELRAHGFRGEFGIHTHNDAELAVANALRAVATGCRQVQGTINGYGERCGNANLVSLIPTLELKLGYTTVRSTSLARLREISQRVSEICNLPHDTQAPYVGISAFAHKGGIHVAAVEKVSSSYEHIEPSLVGNTREILVSDLSGKGNIRAAAQSATVQANVDTVLQSVKELESLGYQFEQAPASLELLMRRSTGSWQPPFEIIETMLFSELQGLKNHRVQASIKVRVHGAIVHTASDGNGPVHAIDSALRKALEPSYPALSGIALRDYKVRILNPEHATAAITRVVVEAGTAKRSWTTIGCSSDIVEASMRALVDSYQYGLLQEESLARKGTQGIIG